MSIRRIAIIGISGVGKTYLANELGKKLGIPVYHHDTFIWKENWIEASEEEASGKIRKILEKDAWIFEGFIYPLADERIERADVVLYLDYSGWQAFLGGLRRWWKYRGKVRPEMPAGNTENFDWKYLRVMFKRWERPEIEEAIQKHASKITRLRSPRETKQYIKKLLGP